jgi:hypothetical protein
MATTSKGWISDHYEQGMEGERWHIFQDEAYAETRTTGWRHEGVRYFRASDRLTIFSDDGTVLWSGQLRLRRGWLGWRTWLLRQRALPHDPAYHPPDVSSDTWQEWFRRRPPLAATLERG